MYQSKVKGTEKAANYLNIQSCSFDRVKVWENGGITFDLELNGIKIYGCRVAESNKGDFIGFPQRKGKDGKYYSHAYARISPEEQEQIIMDVKREAGVY